MNILLKSLPACCFLLCFHTTHKFRETLVEGFFTYYACYAKQGRLIRYFKKSELNLSGKDFLVDCVFCEGKHKFERMIHIGFWYPLHVSCSPGNQVDP